MSTQTADPATGQRRRPPVSLRGVVLVRLVLVRLVLVLLVLALATWGCTESPVEDDGAADAEVTAPPAPPTIPSPDASMADQTDVDRPLPPTPRPRAGAVVLAHLEGPVTDRDATDVVIRNERGTELDRFRLPGAVQVHAGSGGHWALVETSTGQWARYDAVSGELTLVTFEGDAPRGVPTVQGPLAWWDQPERPWLLRLDTGTSISLRAQMAEGGRVVAATPDGGHVLVRSDRDHVIATSDGEVRTLPPQASVTLSADGTTVASTAGADAGADVYLEALDGSDRRLLATVPDVGVPVVLGDGRVLVLGPAARIIPPGGTGDAAADEEAGGGLTDLPALPGASGPVLAEDGVRVLVATDDGLVLVDPDAASATTVPDTQGWTVHPFGPQTVLWAASQDPAQPGAAAVDPTSGAALTALADTPTGAFTAVSADGRTATLRVGHDGSGQAILTADGETQIAADAREVALHPDGALIAATVIAQASNSLVVADITQVGDLSQAAIEIPTGRSPAWLATED